MGRAIAVILLLCSLNLSAQQKLSFRTVDTTTYQQYLRSDWKGLIQMGHDALDQGINYYYLQMRIAYSHFMRQEYRTAIKYYNNALELSSKDPVAHEYLYYCFLYSGRYNDALLQTKYLTTAQKKAMNIVDSSGIVSLGVMYSYASSNAESIQDAIVNDLVVSQNGVQKTTNNFHLPKLSISHNIGQHLVIKHSLSYLQKNEFSYTISSGFFLSPEQIMSQIEYGVSMDITPAQGWTISPGLNYLSLKVPLFAINNYGPSVGRDRQVLEYMNISNRVFSLLVSKELRFFNIGLSYANNNFNTLKANQAGIHSSIYPLANLNLYYTFDLYFQHLQFNEQSDLNYIFNHTLGFKIFKNLWMELSNSMPEKMNLYDVRDDISYNNIEKIASAYSATLIVPVYKANLKFFGYCGYNFNNSYFFPNQELLDPINKHLYNSLIITGGLTWTK